MNKKVFSILFFTFIILKTQAQQIDFTTDSVLIKKIFDDEIINGQCYKNLEFLCKNFPQRLSASTNEKLAVQWCYRLIKGYNFDSVYLQDVMVPHWERGPKETAYYILPNGDKINMNACALGGSIGTKKEGILANCIKVENWQEFEKKGETGSLKNKIVFVNIPMNATFPNTFHAYGDAWKVRGSSAIIAAKYGAIGVVIRSLSATSNPYPHTGMMRYVDSITKIPAMAISTKDADLLSEKINQNQEVKIFFKQDCKQLPDEKSYNIIAEIKGNSNPNKIIDIGGHLDSWDLGEGAHDDGAGVMHCLDALNLLKNNTKNNNTIRCIFFINEENGNRGGEEYAKQNKLLGENHVFALESDAGGFVPRGFGISCDNDKFEILKKFEPLFEPYFMDKFENDGGGTDIGPMKKNGTIISELIPDNQRYFEVHHTSNDIFENVNERELKFGAFGIASFIYLIDKYEIF